MSTPNINDKLPGEMLEKIFQLLPPRDLMSVVEVCRRWRETGEAPALWAWVRLMVTRHNQSYMPEMLDTRRLQTAHSITVMHFVSEELLQAIVRHRGLKKIDMSHVHLSIYLEPGLLTTTVTKMEIVAIRNTSLTSQLWEALLTGICGDTNISSLDISYNTLSSIGPTLLVTAVNKLKTVNMRGTDLTSQQLEALFTAISRDTNINSLDISGNILSSIVPTLLVTAVNKLKTVTMYDTDLTREQVTRIRTLQNTTHIKM